MMLHELARTGGRIGDRLVVACERDHEVELGDLLERAEVVAQGIGTSVRIDPDRRADPRQDGVARQQDAAPQEREVAVRVAGKVNDPPAVDRLPGLERLGSDGVHELRGARRTPRRRSSPSAGGIPWTRTCRRKRSGTRPSPQVRTH
jgi:hypothetical protein